MLLDDNDAYTFLGVLLIMMIVFTAAFTLAILFIAWSDHRWPSDLHDVFRREGALDALARIHGETAYNGIDTCRICNWRILPENSYQGVCDDCWNQQDEQADRLAEQALERLAASDEWDQESVDQEWHDLMLMIDDEAQDQEDHR